LLGVLASVPVVRSATFFCRASLPLAVSIRARASRSGAFTAARSQRLYTVFTVGRLASVSIFVWIFPSVVVFHFSACADSVFCRRLTSRLHSSVSRSSDQSSFLVGLDRAQDRLLLVLELSVSGAFPSDR
jgi:hypothetical protein